MVILLYDQEKLKDFKDQKEIVERPSSSAWYINSELGVEGINVCFVMLPLLQLTYFVNSNACGSCSFFKYE
jgi:hypothetical protein